MKEAKNEKTQGTLFSLFLPLIIGGGLSFILGFTFWPPFYFIFSFIGASISFGSLVNRKSGIFDLGRRISILLVGMLFIVYFGLMQRENMQLEETVVYFAYFLSTGFFTRVLIHYAIAKVFGPLIFSRGFCGWACWTAAILEWLPIKENRQVPKKYTYIRFPVLILSLLIPFLLISSGYDYVTGHIQDDGSFLFQGLKKDQFLWFLAGNGIYYLVGIILAFVFKKKRAFCKVACPVSLIMKIPARFALVKIRPTGNTCTECGICNRNCPMDVDVMQFIKAGKPVATGECILCGNCVRLCPSKAIQ